MLSKLHPLKTVSFDRCGDQEDITGKINIIQTLIVEVERQGQTPHPRQYHCIPNIGSHSLLCSQSMPRTDSEVELCESSSLNSLQSGRA